MRLRNLFHGITAAGALCSPALAQNIYTPPQASQSIREVGIRRHIQVLASDEYAGRAPGTKGEDCAVAYIAGEFKRIGIRPGNPDGTYFQDVPLIGITTKATGSIATKNGTIDLRFPDDWVAVSRRPAASAAINDSDLVFVGYGVVAPEYGWDDYKGLDVKGKTLVMLVNDPPVPDPNDPAKLDNAMFKGRAMTYYGRWTYKYEIASEKGAAAVLLIHETGPAGYPYEVVKGSWGRENFDLVRGDNDPAPPRVSLESWITTDTAKKLFASCGQDFDSLKKAAVEKDFKPVALEAKANLHATNTVRNVRSRNVVGRILGYDPNLQNEHVIFTAHWDHLGRDESLVGDQVFNGAADNASGVAQMIEMAEAMQKVWPTKRSVLFLAVTAEEKGLLGSRHYAAQPIYPLEKTLAVINMDVTNTWGRTRDMTSVGFGLSTLDDVFTQAAQALGRAIGPDAEPEKGLYYRSDHFEFAKQGVPALDPKPGSDFLGKPPRFGFEKREAYVKNDYHKPSDEIKPDWDLNGAADDARLLLEVAYRILTTDAYPEWKPGAEFKTKREAMLKAADDKRKAEETKASEEKKPE